MKSVLGLNDANISSGQNYEHRIFIYMYSFNLVFASMLFVFSRLLTPCGIDSENIVSIIKTTITTKITSFTEQHQGTAGLTELLKVS